MEKISDMNDEHQNQLVDFMFKCLDEHKKSASVLFQFFKFEDINNEIVNRLLNKYEDVFDFNMINSKDILKKTSEMMSEINKIKLFQSTKISKLTETVESQANEINELKKTIENQENEIKKLNESNKIEISQLKDDINELTNQTSVLKQIDQLIKKLEADISHNKDVLLHHENMNKSFVTRNQLRQCLTVGIEKTRNIQFGASPVIWENDEKNYCVGTAHMGDYKKNWPADGGQLYFRPNDALESMLASIPP